MRYTTGQEYLFIRFTVSGMHPIDQQEMPNPIESISPWLNKDVTNKVEIKRLVCLEHHKVPCEFDPDGEKKYDGFRFACPKETGSITFWDNQFPHASYGQTSDIGNRIVTSAEMSEDNKSINAVHEFYDLQDCVEELWKHCVKPNSYSDTISIEQARKVLLDIESLLEDEEMAFKVEERKFAKSTLVSVELVPAGDDTLSVKELFELKWQDDWI